MSLFTFTTNEIQLFKNLIDSLKEIMIETNMEFSNKFIKMRKMNSMNSIYCQVCLNSDKLNEDGNYYECEYPIEKPLIVGINLLHLSKILRTVGSDNILQLTVDEQNKNTLKIRVQNTSRLALSDYTLNFVEVNEEKISVPSVEFDRIIEIDSKYFQKQIKDLINLDSIFVDITSCGEQMKIKGSGGYITRETTIGADDDSNDNVDDKTRNKIQHTIKFLKKTEKICQGTYNTKDLLICTSKFTYLSPKFTLNLKNDIPLVINIDVKTFGKITLVINLQAQNS